MVFLSALNGAEYSLNISIISIHDDDTVEL